MGNHGSTPSSFDGMARRHGFWTAHDVMMDDIEAEKRRARIIQETERLDFFIARMIALSEGK